MLKQGVLCDLYTPVYFMTTSTKLYSHKQTLSICSMQVQSQRYLL